MVNLKPSSGHHRTRHVWVSRADVWMDVRVNVRMDVRTDVQYVRMSVHTDVRYVRADVPMDVRKDSHTDVRMYVRPAPPEPPPVFTGGSAPRTPQEDVIGRCRGGARGT